MLAMQLRCSYFRRRFAWRCLCAFGSGISESKAYNVAWNNPAKYFASLHDLNIKKLRLCSETILVDTDIMRNYLDALGDNDGVVIQSAG